MNQSHWDKIYSDAGNHPWTGVPEWLNEVIQKYRPSPETALDLGTGEGDKAAWLSEQGFAVTGIDISPLAIQAAKRHSSNGTYIVADLATLPDLNLPNNAFGLVLDLVSSHFLPGERQPDFFAAVARLLSPRGIYVYTRLDSTGPDAPAWIKQVTADADSLNSWLAPFVQVETTERSSDSLADTRLSRYVLKAK